MNSTNEDPMSTIQRLVAATNAHDLEGIVACFAEGYTLDAPLHPARSFRGKEQVRRHWGQILGAVRDISVAVPRFARAGAPLWTEWEMKGTRPDRNAHQMRGVFVFTVGEGLVQQGRMFLEPVEDGGPTMDAAVGRVLGASGPPGAQRA
jgi:ketosteroid isomerase-like protein